MQWIGVDEAGRGPVLGPLVVAGFATTDPDALEGLGLRDSKKLSPSRRERLARILRDLPDARVFLDVIPPHRIDTLRETMSLNALEAASFGGVVRQLRTSGPQHVYLDAADVDADRFGTEVARHSGLDVASFTSEHQADDRYPVVMAASILAKTVRDQEIENLTKRLERKLPWSLGSGYPSDPKTRSFLLAYRKQFGVWPEGTRHSWATLRTLEGELQQRRLRFD